MTNRSDAELTRIQEHINRTAGCGFWPLWVLTDNKRDKLIFRSLRDPAFTMMQKQWYVMVNRKIRPWPWFPLWQWWNRMKWQTQTGQRWWAER